jgi:hypothetical protein
LFSAGVVFVANGPSLRRTGQLEQPILNLVRNSI